ncbi:hypothetical protein K438DRAFT_17987 [Mycena galopus ATCC 62051]|nr:hypothetical protein K438DRAFT_17987 [Mycena galopus ATCC 62051]
MATLGTTTFGVPPDNHNQPSTLCFPERAPPPSPSSDFRARPPAHSTARFFYIVTVIPLVSLLCLFPHGLASTYIAKYRLAHTARTGSLFFSSTCLLSVCHYTSPSLLFSSCPILHTSRYT